MKQSPIDIDPHYSAFQIFYQIQNPSRHTCLEMSNGTNVLVGLSIITLGALLLFLLIRICIDMKKCGNLCCPNSCCGLDPPTRIVLQDARTIQNQDVERNASVCYKACCKQSKFQEVLHQVVCWVTNQGLKPLRSQENLFTILKVNLNQNMFEIAIFFLKT